MTHPSEHHVDELLSAYFEGDLGLAERRAVDVHLRSCLRCAKIVRDIEGIREDAASLPEMEPSRDLWAGIAQRIEAPVIDLKSRAERAPVRRTWRMAAAAVVLMAVSSGVTYLVSSGGLRAAGSETAAANPGVVTPTAPRSGSPVLVSEPLPPEQQYDLEIGRLRAILDERRGDLDTATVSAVEKSIKAIDRAILDARQALATDASSQFLNDQLNKALEKKLGVLRRVALLPVGAS
jgi:hypothetical protein